MSTYTFSIKFYQGGQNRIIVPHRYYKRFHLLNTIRYGFYESGLECLSHHKNESTIYISSLLKRNLNLPNSNKLSFNLTNAECTITLTLGVFIAGFHTNSLLLGDRTRIFELMSQAGQQYGYETIFFGQQHIAPDTKQVHGYYYKQNSWKQKIVPLPSVIYDRIPNRLTEHHPDVVGIKQYLQKESIIFNQGFFNKWEIYERLMKRPICSYLLPETILNPSSKKIIQLLHRHPVYIKPIHGSKGEGIVKCLMLDTGEIECRFYQNDKAQKNRYVKFSSFLEQHFPNGFKGYVVQKEIPLLTIGTEPIDFRVHANKNHRNNWEIATVCVKQAGKGSLTTHVKRGGQIHTMDEVLGKDSERIFQKLKDATILLSSNLEQSTEEPLGEIGFDFGIDTEGKVWMFEANSKPGFGIFQHDKIYKDAYSILSYPYKYAFFLHNQLMNETIHV